MTAKPARKRHPEPGTRIASRLRAEKANNEETRRKAALTVADNVLRAGKNDLRELLDMLGFFSADRFELEALEDEGVA